MKRTTALSGSVLAFAALLVAAALIGPALAKGFAHGPGGFMDMHGEFGMGPGMHIFRMMEDLDLTPEQRERLGAIMDENMPRMREFAFAMMDDRKALEALVRSDSYDEAQVREIAGRIGARTTDMIVSGTKCMADMREVLTDEQLKTLDDMREQRDFRGRRHHRR